MATIAIPAGKNGVITLNSLSLYLEAWELSIDIDNELYAHFGQTADAMSVIWKGVVTGQATGEATVRGKFDNTAAAYLPSSKGVWLDSTHSGWLGYTASVGFNISYTIISVRTAQDATKPAGATYEARLKITACVFNAAGP